MTDFSFRLHPSPVGEILIVAGPDGIVTLHPFDGPLDAELARVSLQLHASPVPDDAAGGDIDVQLDEYFEGERQGFDVELDWRLAGGFRRAALEAVRGIPYGETAGYGEVAISAGSPTPSPSTRTGRWRRSPSRTSATRTSMTAIFRNCRPATSCFCR